MKIGQIVLLPFPFADSDFRKVRPALIVGVTSDNHADLLVCAISSVVPSILSNQDFLVRPNENNKLRTDSIIKTDRIATVRKSQIVLVLGELSKVDYLNVCDKVKMQFKCSYD